MARLQQGVREMAEAVERTKDFLTAVQDRNVEAAETAFRAVQKELDRVSTTSTADSARSASLSLCGSAIILTAATSTHWNSSYSGSSGD